MPLPRLQATGYELFAKQDLTTESRRKASS